MPADLTKPAGASGRSDVETAAPDLAYTVPRVNLLPDEITAARALRRTQTVLGGCVLAVLGAIGGTFLLTQQQADAAATRLAAEQARTASLNAEQGEFAQVPVVLGQLEAAETARTTAMGSDVLWYAYLGQLAATYPDDVWLGDITATMSGPGATAISTDPLATPGIGTVMFSGSSVTPPDIADWLDVIDATPGLADAALSTATRTDREGSIVYDFTSQAVITDAALSHRFDRKDG